MTRFECFWVFGGVRRMAVKIVRIVRCYLLMCVCQVAQQVCKGGRRRLDFGWKFCKSYFTCVSHTMCQWRAAGCVSCIAYHFYRPNT